MGCPEVLCTSLTLGILSSLLRHNVGCSTDVSGCRPEECGIASHTEQRFLLPTAITFMNFSTVRTIIHRRIVTMGLTRNPRLLIVCATGPRVGENYVEHRSEEHTSEL